MSVDLVGQFIDQISAPAFDAADALGAVERAAREVDKALKAIKPPKGLDAVGDVGKKAQGSVAPFSKLIAGVDKLFGPKAAGGVLRVAGAVASAHDSYQKLSGAMSKTGGAGESIKVGVDNAKSAVEGLTSALMAAGQAGGALVASGVRYAAEMAQFKENTLFSLRFVTGSKDKADEIFRVADELARATGQKTTMVAESMRDLMASGFSQKESKAITAAVADIKAMNPSADVSGLNGALAKMQGSQKFSLEVAESILRAGIDDSKFYEVLQQLTGSKDRKGLMQKISAGQVDDKVGLAAVLKAVQAQGGGGALGSVAATRATETVGGAIEVAQAQFERLFLAINSSPVGTALARIATQVGNLFDPAQKSGERMVGLFDRLATLGGGLLERLLSGGNIEGAFDAVVSALEVMVPLFESLGGGLMQGLGESFEVVGLAVEKAFGKADKAATAKALGEAIRNVGMALGYFVGGVTIALGLAASLEAAWLTLVYSLGAGVVGLVGSIGSGIGALEGWIKGTIMSVRASAASIGTAITDGISSGLTSTWQGLVAKLEALADMLPKAVKDILGIHSPSRVFAELGTFTAEGFVVGLDQVNVNDALAEMMAPPKPPAVPSGAAAGVRPSAGPVNVTINVDARGASPDDATQWRAMLRRELAQVFQELGLELGVLT